MTDAFARAEAAGLVLRDPFRDPPAPSAAPIAPWPVVDRCPTVLGSNLTLQTISATMRTATTGYRLPWVDLLDELLERDTHAQSVLTQRILTVAGARLEITPADCDEDEEQDAEDVAAMVRRAMGRIADLKTAIVSLMWAVYYGVAALETSWERTGTGWVPTRLHFIHPRRLSYPDPSSWSVRIWDQGQVTGDPASNSPTQRLYGLDPAKYPGKFIVHTPMVRGDYPTREGLGRVLAFYMAFKTMAMRGLANTAERFGKPWAFAYYTTSDTGTPRAANEKDILAANALVQAMGIGAAAGAAVPDTVKVVIERVLAGGKAGKNMFQELLETCNAEISKAVLTQTLTTEQGAKGSQALGSVHERGSLRIATSDACDVAETLRWQLVATIVRLNAPDKMHLLPHVRLHVEDEPDANQIIDAALKLAGGGAPVDADEVAERAGVALLPREDETKGRRLMPIKPVDVAALEALNRGEEIEIVKPPPPTASEPKGEGETASAANDNAPNGGADNAQEPPAKAAE